MGKESKKNIVVRLLKEGKPYKDIVAETGISYNYVLGIACNNGFSKEQKRGEDLSPQAMLVRKISSEIGMDLRSVRLNIKKGNIILKEDGSYEILRRNDMSGLRRELAAKFGVHAVTIDAALKKGKIVQLEDGSYIKNTKTYPNASVYKRISEHFNISRAYAYACVREGRIIVNEDGSFTDNMADRRVTKLSKARKQAALDKGCSISYIKELEKKGRIIYHDDGRYEITPPKPRLKSTKAYKKKTADYFLNECILKCGYTIEEARLFTMEQIVLFRGIGIKKAAIIYDFLHQ